MPVKIKICGLSTKDVMAAALNAGADYVGLVFYPKSPRNVTLGQAAELAAMARGRAKIVALAVDPDDSLLEKIVKEVAPDIIQLHGSEPPERVAQIAAICGLPVMKAIRVENAADAATALDYRDAASLILFDAKIDKANSLPGVAALPGGNGLTFDWSALDGVKEDLGFMLSGGLDADNVADAISATGAAAVDVSSGVETAPGVKDIQKINAFIAAARSVRES